MYESAGITVYRPDPDEEGDMEVEVEVRGRFHYVTSHNPRETGERLDSWEVVSPAGIELTDEECEWAEEALYRRL